MYYTVLTLIDVYTILVAYISKVDHQAKLLPDTSYLVVLCFLFTGSQERRGVGESHRRKSLGPPRTQAILGEYIPGT